jgi:hypothetical protein
MKEYGARDAVVVALSFASVAVAACVTSENRCPAGYDYVPAYNACAAEARDASADATSDASTPVSDAAQSDGGASGLGTACGGDPDCAGKKASYCLKDPLSPDDPGVCSVPQCSPSDCGDSYDCCDCGSAAVPQLQSWPRGICVPRESVESAKSFGCVCP